MSAPVLSGTVVVTTPGGPPTQVTAPSGGVVGVSPGTPGPPGSGVTLSGAVATYADLPADLGIVDAGAAYVVQGPEGAISAGKLFVWSGTAWPGEAEGADFRGEQGLPGVGIDSISATPTGLTFRMSTGADRSVVVPAISAAADAADAAAGSASAAAGSAAAAVAAADAAAASTSTAAASASASESAKTDAQAARDAAAGSATAAAAARDDADAAAETASTSADAAVSDRQAAEAAATSAHSAKTNAEAAATTAGLARDSALGSANAAASAATNAGTSASAAHASELAAAQAAQDAADTVGSGVPNATDAQKGGVLLPGGAPGELGGTWDHPTVTGWDAKADLVGGVVPSSQIPALATTETYVVADEAERLALTCETGDVAVQTGNPGRGSYILKGTDPSLPSDWVVLTPPDSAVTSVNGYQGIVVLGKADVGLGSVDNTPDEAKPVSGPQQAALDGKVPTSRTVSAGTGLTGGGNLTTSRTIAVDFGTTAGKVVQGNDARLSDQRTPLDGSVTAAKIAAGAVPADLSLVVFGKDNPRAVGTGDNPFGHKCQRGLLVKAFDVQCLTADASGSLVVELRKNGTPVAGTSHTVAAADQVAGTRKTGLNAQFATGDVLTVAVTGVGATPGNGLAIHVEAVVA
ncbi:minor tail protein [Gordonia phage Finkle]|uniref:Minor tail protein n=1 Tax=Gordonia phage Finkle TaxID=2926099 RepID=A0A9E7NJX2_9CAUD|nr:minor tail protein [Gordonia phage Finkle]UTN92944.1 minor tail protein [Gordonia phage Finkle]